MFSEKLENLIKAALQDGVLTEQEKAAIIKRAQTEGEDIDEVDIYIQSLQQKRQAELQEKAQKTADEEMKTRKNAQEAKAKYDQEEEKERATILRKCPKCGTLIPNMTTVCPECGYIIEKTKTDKDVTILATLLRECIEQVEFEIDTSIFKIPHRIKNFKSIKKELYEDTPHLYDYDEDCGNTVSVVNNYQGIITEASLYEDNATIRSLLKDVHMKEKKILLSEINGSLKMMKNIINPVHEKYAHEEKYDDNMHDLEICYQFLKDNFSDICKDDIARIEKDVQEITKKHETLLSDPKYLKKVKQIKREKERYWETPIYERIFWAFALLLLTFSGLIFVLAFFEKGREFIKWAYDEKVMDN